MNWQYTPYIIPLLITTFISVIVILYAWRRRTTPAAKAFILLVAAVISWSLGYILELSGMDLSTKVLWGKVQYFGIASLPVLWLSFALQYTNRDGWLTRRNLTLLAVIPLITVLLVWTNETHGLIWRQIEMDESGPFLALDVSYGEWFWVHSAFSYLLLLQGTYFLLLIPLRSTYLYRQQAILMLVGVLAPWVGNGVYLSGLSPIPNMDLTPFAFTISGLALGWSLFRFRFLDIVPVARRVVVDNLQDGVIVLDAQHRVADLNLSAQQIVGYDAKEAIGKMSIEMFSRWPDLIDRFSSITTAQTEVVLDEGDVQRHFNLNISPLYGRQHQITGYLIVFHDITEHKLVQATLARARDDALATSRLKSELLSKVSHELRTPLGGILGFSQILKEGLQGPLSAQQTETISQVIDSTLYLTRLVDELLDQAQLEAGKLLLTIKPFAPQDILNQVQTKMCVLAQDKGLSLATDIAADVPDIISNDPIRVQQILVNLVGNAIKFTQTGTVQVRFYRPDTTYWAMEVSDTGIGIPPNAQAHIFEPFGQVDGSMTREYVGTGLGLSIVKQLTTLMGGKVTIQSNVGQGSTFTVLLPLSPGSENLAG